MFLIQSGPAALPVFHFKASSVYPSPSGIESIKHYGTFPIWETIIVVSWGLLVWIIVEILSDEEDWIKHQITLTNWPNYLEIQKINIKFNCLRVYGTFVKVSSLKRDYNKEYGRLIKEFFHKICTHIGFSPIGNNLPYNKNHCAVYWDRTWQLLSCVLAGSLSIHV